MKLTTLLATGFWLLTSAAIAAEPQPIVGVWFQPARNVPMLAGMGIDVFLGPEVENAKNLSAADLAARRLAWIKAVAEANGRCVLKRNAAELAALPPLPAHCIGLLLDADEPNRNNTGPTDALRTESAKLRAAYPGVKIWLSLAGARISSANFTRAHELAVYQEYAKVADVFLINFYSKNLNADRYSIGMTGDIVRKLKEATGREVVACVEMNDQQLPLPPAGEGGNRTPTPTEISDTVGYAMNSGAAGIVWFATQDKGKYGWTPVPGKGDSYWPLIDRAGKSIDAQLRMVTAVSQGLAPAAPAATLADVILMVNEQSKQIALLRARVERQSAILEGVFRVPTTQGSR